MPKRVILDSDSESEFPHQLRQRPKAVSYKESDVSSSESAKSDGSEELDNASEDTTPLLARNLKLKVPSLRQQRPPFVAQKAPRGSSETQNALKRRRHVILDDEEYVANDDEDLDALEPDLDFDEEEEYERARQREEERNFIASDDEDDVYSSRKSRRRRRKTQKAKASKKRRLRRKVDDSSDESYQEDADDNDDLIIDNDSIRDELEDLKSASEVEQTPPKKQLRERKNVNYEIPPPLPDTSNIEEFATTLNVSFTNGSAAPRRPGRPPLGPGRGLFSVAGPFGGNDMDPLFGSNAPSNPLPPTNLNDSLSSDDDFVTRPFGGQASAAPGKKQKSTMADSDPLGIQTDIDFLAVGGLDSYINQLKEMVALPLLYPEVYAKFGITPPRGVLFHGPPGNGKTLMARALALSCLTNERKITFFMRKGADCLSKWVGEAERQLRLLFEEARNQQPLIIFFDEIDGLAPVRSLKQEQIHASIVSTLLALMDGMDNRGQVIVIGATNRPDAIDPALRRPGRFDREFYFLLPDLDARVTILKIHTKKWSPKPDEKLINRLAEMTKGYGGSDIRALCTEAALRSIKRSYPQIYDLDQKLVVDPEKIVVTEADFMGALDRIVPSSARQGSGVLRGVPEFLEPLFRQDLENIKALVALLVASKGEFVVADGIVGSGVSRHSLFKQIHGLRVYRPRLLISGRPGMGQEYIGPAVLNLLEGFQVQSLDLSTLFGDSGRTPEAAIIQMFLEARRNTPAVVYIPNLEIWMKSVPESAKSTLEGLLRGLGGTEKVFLLGVCEKDNLDGESDLEIEISRFFGLSGGYEIRGAGRREREEFFLYIWLFLETKPKIEEENGYEKFREIEDYLEGGHEETKAETEEEKAEKAKLKEKEDRKKAQAQYYKDIGLRNKLKQKLGMLMNNFKTRYKRFQKPIIPLIELGHLFEPANFIDEKGEFVDSVQYVAVGEGEKMILDRKTGKKYYNMDLLTMEERLWNGYYTEPKQFLKDLGKIVHDLKSSGDKERIFRANELFVNVQVMIEEQFPPDFLKECRELRKREEAREVERNAGTSVEDVHKTTVENEGGDRNIGRDVLPINGGSLVPQSSEKIVADSDGDIIADVSNVSVSVTEDAVTTTQTKVSVQTTKINQTTGPHEDAETPDPVQKEESDQASHTNLEGSPKPSEPAQEPAPKYSQEELEEHKKFKQKMEEFETKELKLDRKKLETLKARLLDETEGYNIENLEMIHSLLSEVVWDCKGLWDRNKFLKKLEKKMDVAFKIVSRMERGLS